MNGWKTLTDMEVNQGAVALFGSCRSLTWLRCTANIEAIEGHCSELLIHAADVEGLCQGIDEELVRSESMKFVFHGTSSRSML